MKITGLRRPSSSVSQPARPARPAQRKAQRLFLNVRQLTATMNRPSLKDWLAGTRKGCHTHSAPCTQHSATHTARTLHSAFYSCPTTARATHITAH